MCGFPAEIMKRMDPRLVFDVGMYDGNDTAHYLHRGFRVVAIEANPLYVDAATRRFAEAIREKRLIIVPCGVAETEGTLPFYVCKEDAGSSSFSAKHLATRSYEKIIDVPCLPFAEIMKTYGVPYYLKVDIETHDALCILKLNAAARPAYVSYEANDDAPQLMEHLRSIGYLRFKVINQINFCELGYINSIPHRLQVKLRHMAGQPSEKTGVIRHGYKFVSGRMSGPMAEQTAGNWRDFESTSSAWKTFAARFPPDKRFGWYDIHAKL
jgi:FkbM family methyltransferase